MSVDLGEISVSVQNWPWRRGGRAPHVYRWWIYTADIVILMSVRGVSLLTLFHLGYTGVSVRVGNDILISSTQNISTVYISMCTADLMKTICTFLRWCFKNVAYITQVNSKAVISSGMCSAWNKMFYKSKASVLLNSSTNYVLTSCFKQSFHIFLNTQKEFGNLLGQMWIEKEIGVNKRSLAKIKKERKCYEWWRMRWCNRYRYCLRDLHGST